MRRHRRRPLPWWRQRRLCMHGGLWSQNGEVVMNCNLVDGGGGRAGGWVMAAMGRRAWNHAVGVVSRWMVTISPVKIAVAGGRGGGDTNDGCSGLIRGRDRRERRTTAAGGGGRAMTTTAESASPSSCRGFPSPPSCARRQSHVCCRPRRRRSPARKATALAASTADTTSRSQRVNQASGCSCIVFASHRDQDLVQRLPR